MLHSKVPGYNLNGLIDSPCEAIPGKRLDECAGIGIRTLSEIRGIKFKAGSVALRPSPEGSCMLTGEVCGWEENPVAREDFPREWGMGTTEKTSDCV